MNYAQNELGFKLLAVVAEGVDASAPCRPQRVLKQTAARCLRLDSLPRRGESGVVLRRAVAEMGAGERVLRSMWR